ncbi:hypothetical protein ACFLX9_01965 [Chloroflexota bacterium]
MDVVSTRTADLTGSVTAIAYMLLIIALLTARLAERPELGQWIGLVSILAMIPLAYLFYAGLKVDRPFIYLVWIGLMLLFLLFELIVDYILKLDFRSNLRTAIPYVMFFFAATGGLLGVAAQAGKQWMYMAVALYLVMAAMAFIQRAKTGL